jgi:hypothetical protein
MNGKYNKYSNYDALLKYKPIYARKLSSRSGYNNNPNPEQNDDTILLIAATVGSYFMIYTGRGGGKGSLYNNHPPY